jgi:hypothetical protein
MIIEIPDKFDFLQSGLSMLNLAWDAIASLYLDYEYVENEEWDEEDGDVKQEFWKAAQHPISVALALSQQGIELLLKSRIAEISPFLLLSGSPRDWPSGCNEKDTSFADFRTIEAHELIRAHDAVVAERLSESFKMQFERLRRLRNVIFHGVAKRSRPAAEDVFKIILEAVDNLYQPRSWFALRRAYLENTPKFVAYPRDQLEIMLVSEALSLIKLLSPSEAKRFLGFDKRQRAYICYSCAVNCSDIDLQPKTALLQPNTSDSNQVYCFVCNELRSVKREVCGIEGCRGNVLDAEDEVCLTCYSGRPR